MANSRICKVATKICQNSQFSLHFLSLEEPHLFPKITIASQTKNESIQKMAETNENVRACLGLH
jgi:hypothetical protein